MSNITINPETRESIVCIGRDTILKFVDLVGDKNPVHRDRKFARASGFQQGIPVPGTLLHAYFEQFASKLGYDLQTFSLIFKKAAYPNNLLTFRKTLGGNGRLELKCLDSEGDLVALCRSELSNSTDKKDNGKLIRSYDYKISREMINGFYSLLGREPEERIPISLISSLVPSALLKFISEKSGDCEGVYKGLNCTSHNDPTPGDLEIGLYIIGQREIRERFFYRIRGKCSQGGRRILSADLNVITGFEFKKI